jgi:hypothetical protein
MDTASRDRMQGQVENSRSPTISATFTSIAVFQIATTNRQERKRIQPHQ